MKCVVWRLAVMALLLFPGCAEIDRTRGEVGQRAPEYAAVNLDGDSVRLADLEGSVVLLNVWATWCAPCREEIPALQALYEAHVDRGLTVVGVSVDGAREVPAIRRFATEFQMSYPIWHDPDDVFGVRFRTVGVPVSLLVDRGGVIRWRKMGPVEMSDPGLNAALETALGES